MGRCSLLNLVLWIYALSLAQVSCENLPIEESSSLFSTENEVDSQLENAYTEIQNLKEELQKVRLLLKTLKSETSVELLKLKKSFNSRRVATKLDITDIKGKLEELDNRGANLTRVKLDVKALNVWKEETNIKLETLNKNQTEFNKQEDQLGSTDEDPLQKHQGTTGKLGGWQLGSAEIFDVQKTFGIWFTIEGFRRNFRHSQLVNCWEETLEEKANKNIECIQRYKYLNTNGRDFTTLIFESDTQNSYFWIKSGSSRMWMTTDYANWGIILTECDNTNPSSCDGLYILSRTKTILTETLEILRDVAETNGFPRAYGSLIDQTRC